MHIFDDAWGRDDLPAGAVATIGNFDGVHLGQQAILERVVARARECGRPALVITFEPHPLKVLQPERAPLCLSTREQKLRLLAELDTEAVAIVRFTTEFARVPARRFAEEFLQARLGVHELWVGSRFVFGRGREGDLALLRELGRSGGFEARGVDEVQLDGEAVSSTRIRAAVAAGRVEQAAAMLGRPYSVTGSVVSGEGRGRRLGWPTANLAVDNELFPGDGVYAGRLAVDGSHRARAAVSNVGRRPTFGGETRLVETHLLDGGEDLYGRRVEVGFERRLRGEERFDSVDELVNQIEQDVRAAREYFAETTC